MTHLHTCWLQHTKVSHLQLLQGLTNRQQQQQQQLLPPLGRPPQYPSMQQQAAAVSTKTAGTLPPTASVLALRCRAVLPLLLLSVQTKQQGRDLQCQQQHCLRCLSLPVLLSSLTR
jgi:hypothetical protein